MGTFTESAPTSPTKPESWFVGRTFFYIQDPATMLSSGYDRIKIFRRKNATDPNWVEITAPETRLVIRADRSNYAYLDQKAERTFQYRPTLSDSTNAHPDVPQVDNIQDAVDTSYEALMTVQELKDLYMWGLLGLFLDDVGNPFPDRLYVHFLKYGITKFETKTRIKVFPSPILGERHDYSPAEWQDGRYWQLPLDEFPCVSIEKVTLTFPGSTPFEFPTSWLQLDKKLGILSIVPDSITAFPITGAGLPWRGRSLIPGAIQVDYTAGFPIGQVPENIRDVIGKEASSGPLNIGGDLVGGAAIASQSMAIDGLSQSVNTTSSPTMAGFGARLIQYNNELKRDYPIITAYYKGIRLLVG